MKTKLTNFYKISNGEVAMPHSDILIQKLEPFKNRTIYSNALPCKKKTASFHFYSHTIPVRNKLPATRFTYDNVHFQRKNIAQEILLYPNLVEIRLPNIFSTQYSISSLEIQDITWYRLRSP